MDASPEDGWKKGDVVDIWVSVEKVDESEFSRGYAHSCSSKCNYNPFDGSCDGSCCDDNDREDC